MAITLLYTFVPRTTILSAEVNANFSLLASRAVDKTGDTLTGTILTQSLAPNVTGTYDLGSSTLFFRNGYVRNSLVLGQTTANYTLSWANPAAARAISFEDPGGTDIVAYKSATQILTNKTLSAPTFSGTYSLGGTPSIPLIAGEVTISGVSDNTGLSLIATTTNRPGVLFSNATTGLLAFIQATDDKGLLFYGNGTSTFAQKVHASGGVSFGDTTDPGAENVHIAGTLDTDDTIQGVGSIAITDVSMFQTVNTNGVIASPRDNGIGGTGASLTAGHNTFGSGAAGTLSLYTKAGVRYYLWVDATGDLRIGSDAPNETGSISDTSGTVVGTQS